MNDLTIKEFTQLDDVVLQDISMFVEKVFVDFPPNIPTPLADLQVELAPDKKPYVLIAYQAEEIVGVCMTHAWKYIENYRHIWIVGIEKSQRGKGLGTRLYSMAEKYSKAELSSGMTISTNNTFRQQLRLLIKLGFDIYDVGPSRMSSLLKIKLKKDFIS